MDISQLACFAIYSYNTVTRVSSHDDPEYMGSGKKPLKHLGYPRVFVDRAHEQSANFISMIAWPHENPPLPLLKTVEL